MHMTSRPVNVWVLTANEACFCSVPSPSAAFPELRGAVESSGTRRGCDNAPGLSTGDTREDAIALGCRPEPDSTARRSCRRWPIDARRIGFRYLGRLSSPARGHGCPWQKDVLSAIGERAPRIGLFLRRNVRRPTELGDKKAIDRVWRFGCISPRECWFPARTPFRCILGRPAPPGGAIGWVDNRTSFVS